MSSIAEIARRLIYSQIAEAAHRITEKHKGNPEALRAIAEMREAIDLAFD